MHPLIWFDFAIYLILSLSARLINLNLGNKIERVSDGGGCDAGSSYIYVPDLEARQSINWEDGFYNHQNVRTKALTWFLLPIYGVFSIFFCVMIILMPRVYWIFSDRNPSNNKESKHV